MPLKTNQSVSVVNKTLTKKKNKKTKQRKTSLYCFLFFFWFARYNASSVQTLTPPDHGAVGEADLYGQQAGNEPEKNIWALSPAALLPFSTNLTIEFNKHNAYWSGSHMVEHGAGVAALSKIYCESTRRA